MPLFGKPRRQQHRDLGAAGRGRPPRADRRRRARTACSPPTSRSRSTCCSARRASSRSGSSSARRSTTSGCRCGKWGQNQELQVLTQAMYNARELAMSRMIAEADHLGADGVVGVQLRMQQYAWGQEVLEFIATGTAVRAMGERAGVHKAPDGHAFTSDLSRAGLLPAAGGRRRSGVVRPRDVRLPHRPPVDHADDPAERPEPGDGAVHAGRVRGARARRSRGCRRRRPRRRRTGSSA